MIIYGWTFSWKEVSNKIIQFLRNESIKDNDIKISDNAVILEVINKFENYIAKNYTLHFGYPYALYDTCYFCLLPDRSTESIRRSLNSPVPDNIVEFISKFMEYKQPQIICLYPNY
jgi:hypothetical protein